MGWQERPLFHRDRLSTFKTKTFWTSTADRDTLHTTEFTLTHAAAHGFSTS